VISSDGLVLTHGVGVIGKKRIGMTFDVKLGDGRTTTGKYLGVHRGYRMSLMRLDGDGPWPAVDLGKPSELKAGEFCLSLSYPTDYYQKGRPPLARLTRCTGVSKAEIDVPIEGDLGDIGGPLFNMRGELVGVCHQFGHYLRADLLADIRDDLLSGKFTLKTALPDPFDPSTLLDLSTPVQRSVVRVLCDGEQVALGLIVSKDGHIITKGSNLVGAKVSCELSDGRRLMASLPASSSVHDIALLKVDANDLPVPEWSDRAPDVGVILATVGPEKQPLNIGVAGSTVLTIPRDPGQLGFKAQPASGSAEGVVVSQILFALTNEVLKVGDVITEFDGQPVPNMDAYRQEERRLLDSPMTVAGGRVPVRIRRGKSTTLIMLPIESSSEADRGRPVDDKFAPLAHLDLQGRHTGFGKVFIHDALVRRPRPADIFTPFISRKDFGSPIVDLSGTIVGLNIGSHEGFFTYAIPMNAVQSIVAELSTAAKQEKTPKEAR
jgi:serine protease Do